MPASPDSKYALKNLHQEIDLLDRRIAYCHNQQAFDSEAARVSELHKTETRRESLVKTALAMAGRGVECDPKYLPRAAACEGNIMNPELSLALQTSAPDNPHQQSAENSKELLRLKAGAPGAPASCITTKSVLLLDSNLRSRESRAKAMRGKGVQVDTVATADAARVRMGATKYNLVLVDCGRDTKTAETLVQEIRANNSRQLVGFLVGSPLFIARTLSGGNSFRPQAHATVPMPQKPVPAPEATTFGQRIREAEAEAANQ